MGDRYPKFKAASVQAAPVFLNREETIEKTCDLIIEAGEHGAQVIGFPEGFIPGYPDWFTYMKSNDGLKKFYRQFFLNSVEVPSLSTDKLCEAAKEAEAYVVVGISEREQGTMGSLYNSQIFIDKNGVILGVHRKLIPTMTERLVYRGGDGSTLNVFKTDFGDLGGLICGENTNSLARFALLAMGEKIHVASWPAFASKNTQRYREGIAIRVRYHAFEGKIPVISSSGILSNEIKEIYFEKDEQNKDIVGTGGYSCIIGPNGNFLAGPLEEGEGIIYADIDMEDIIDAKVTHDVVGHYNRFDIFSLSINKNEYKPLKIISGDLDIGTTQYKKEIIENLIFKIEKQENELKNLKNRIENLSSIKYEKKNSGNDVMQ
jgi:aliphatic nitrilase